MDRVTATRVKIKGTSPYSFRKEEWAIITGIVMGHPEGCDKRLCYEAMFYDGTVDYIPVSDKANYEIKEVVDE